MKEYLFKGKTINNQWVQGLLSISQGFSGQPEKGYYISNSAGMPWAYQVIPNSVSLYLWKKDSENDRIFDGDILAFATRHSIYGVVKLCGDEIRFYWDEKTAKTRKEEYLVGMPTNLDMWEIVGHSYDRPILWHKYFFWENL